MDIIFDCERMKHPYTGLYEYCYQLGFSLQKVIGKEHLYYYLPASSKDVFGAETKQIIQKDIHKLFPPRFNAELCHMTYQNTRYMPRSKKLKKVLTIHDLNFLYEKEGRDKRIKAYLRLVQHNINQADHLITISNYVKNDVLENLKTNGKPFDVIHNGCNVLEFEGFDNPLYRPERNFLFSIGTVIPKKNFHVLPGLLQGNDLELIIAGKQGRRYDEKIMEEARRYNVEDRVKVLGTISYKDKYWYFKNCKAFMFPSLAEGFGIPVIEAMHFGKPVFLSTLTSLPEIGGKYAYYFEDFDIEHMRQVFEEGMADYTMNDRTAEIKKHASFFTWDRCAGEYYDIYKKLLNI